MKHLNNVSVKKSTAMLVTNMLQAYNDHKCVSIHLFSTFA